MLVLVIIFGFDTKSNSNKSKNKQVGQHQTKKFLHSKETTNAMKMQTTEWKKIFANHITDKGSVQFSRSVMSDSLQPHELQHARPPCPSPTPGVHRNSCPLSQ